MTCVKFMPTVQVGQNGIGGGAGGTGGGAGGGAAGGDGGASGGTGGGAGGGGNEGGRGGPAFRQVARQAAPSSHWVAEQPPRALPGSPHKPRLPQPAPDKPAASAVGLKEGPGVGCVVLAAKAKARALLVAMVAMAAMVLMVALSGAAGVAHTRTVARA
eukprot:2122903-Prymnesium_polylepis.1